MLHPGIGSVGRSTSGVFYNINDNNDTTYTNCFATWAFVIFINSEAIPAFALGCSKCDQLGYILKRDSGTYVAGCD